MSSLLEHINTPSDLRKLSTEQLQQVCSELRAFLIDTLSTYPGHFASSLGVIELTVALHYVFNTPEDKLIWDVGHQAYGHKILTGRRDNFHTLRQLNGISGFPNPKESPYDSFLVGHASTSISAALGIAIGSVLKNEPKQVIAVIGDGSLTGGLAFEGLNNASSHPNNMLIILNDNDMAIDNNVGGLSQYLVKLTTSAMYNKMRFKLYKALRKSKIATEENKGFLTRFTNSVKSLLSGQHNIFDGLNIRYFGPIDGHDIEGLVKVLSDLKNINGPKILHVKTIKGKGFKPAEESATEWHAPGKFNKNTGKRVIADTNGEPPLFQDVFGHTLVELADLDKRVVGITPAMPSGCSMTYLMDRFPERAFDVGIAESHAVTFAVGMAKEGFLPFCNVYSSFLQRAYDQVIHDAALQRSRIVLCLDRAGFVGEDGATHHGVFDLAALRPIPNLTIAAPMNEHELRNLMHTAHSHDCGTLIIRYPRGKGVMKKWHNEPETITIGKGKKLREGNDIALISIGFIGNDAATAIQRAEKKGISVAHYSLLFLKPLDEELLHEIGRSFKKIITVENGVINGGMGSAILEFMADNGYSPSVKRIGVPDRFVEHGTIAQLNTLCGMDVDGIYNVIESHYSANMS